MKLATSPITIGLEITKKTESVLLNSGKLLNCVSNPQENVAEIKAIL